MEDSFFGFDTSAPVNDDGGGGIIEPSEEQYDALNDETFGSAINGDWEEVHENLVRLDGSSGSSTNTSKHVKQDEIYDYEGNSDLEINFSRVKLDDVDIRFDDSEAGINLDPSVWANPVKPANAAMQQAKPQNFLYSNPESFLRQNIQNPFDMMHQQRIMQQQQQKQQQQQLQQMQQFQQPPLNNDVFGMPSPSMGSRKICTLEDIERNMLTQQKQQNHQRQQQQQQNAQDQQQHQHMHSSTPKSKTPVPTLQQQHQHQLHQSLQMNTQQHHPSQSNGNFFNRSIGPPGFNNHRPNFNLPPQHPLNNMHSGGPPVQHRMPPGFPTLPLLPGHGGPQSMANFRPMPNLPIALNNFAMHPNFNAMRPIGPPHAAPRMPPHPALMNNQNAIQNSANFNQRLVQEIQQNHPMLARGNNIYPGNNGNNNSHHAAGHNNIHNRQDKKLNSSSMRANGNYPEEYDQYSNLMSTRDKHWLIGIQLSQLNTDTPYIDDYYYTVFKERKAKQNGESSQSKAHKDNQLNHPFSQPRGHAQLVMVQMGNKNGTNNRNGQNNRERRNSETKNNDKEPQRSHTYTQMQFENSLGKLQFGSVTAPRKLIDMEVMGAEGNSQLNTSSVNELSTQRKSRHILLHIETLYRIVLKLEDLENPAAIASSLIIKDRKEKEREIALEQAAFEALNKPNSLVDKSSVESNNASINSSISDKFTNELDSKDKLLAKIIPGLTHDKIIAMMHIRKGKALLRRILPHIQENPVRWNIWISIFKSLQTVLKKDKDDNDGTLYDLYPEFEKQIKLADFDIVVRIAYAMSISDKILFALFANKFYISSLVAIMLQAEYIFAENTDTTLTDDLKSKWMQFLQFLSLSLNRTIQNHTISATIESNSIPSMIKHFSRFEDIKLDPLLTLFSLAEEHVN